MVIKYFTGGEAAMSSVQQLRQFVTERLNAAVEEIFGLIEKTIVEYEEEIDRQRKLLDVVFNPKIKLHRIELPQQHCDKDVQTDQERNSSLDQADPERPKIKEEHGELCVAQDVEELALKQEINVALIPPYDESDHSEPEPDHLLLSHSSAVAENQDQEGIKHVDLEPSRNAEPKPKKRRHKDTIHSNHVDEFPMSEIYCNTSTGKKSFECDFCGKCFKSQFSLKEHLRVHTGEKPFVCNICGKSFIRTSTLNIHLRNHSGENLHLCNICGQRFNEWFKLKSHMNTHTDEKPYLCNTCGDRFMQLSHLKNHIKIHARENMYMSKMHVEENSG